MKQTDYKKLQVICVRSQILSQLYSEIMKFTEKLYLKALTSNSNIPQKLNLGNARQRRGKSSENKE